jgi:hypothetical protein
MRSTLLLLALLTLPGAAAAQGAWVTFTSPKRDFLVTAPAKLTPNTIKTDGGYETMTFQHVDFHGGRTYLVVRSTLAETASNEQVTNRLLDNTIDLMEKNVYRVLNKEVVKDKDYQREISYLLHQGMHFRSRIYLKNNFLYTVSVSTKEEKGLEDANSKKFLDSFKLLEVKKK